MPIVTRRTVKEFLGITDDVNNDQIDRLIPQVEADFQIIRKKDFDIDSNDDIDYPDNAEFVASQMIGYLLVTSPFTSGTYSDKKSESIGSYSYTRNDEEQMINGYPKSIVGRIEKVVQTR
jgi:hypothetical protein